MSELGEPLSDLSPAPRGNWTPDDCFPVCGAESSRVTRVVVHEIAATCDREVASVLPRMKLQDDLSFKSLDVIELVLRLEGEFGIEIPRAHVASWRTPVDVILEVRTLVMILPVKP